MPLHASSYAHVGEWGWPFHHQERPIDSLAVPVTVQNEKMKVILQSRGYSKKWNQERIKQGKSFVALLGEEDDGQMVFGVGQDGELFFAPPLRRTIGFQRRSPPLKPESRVMAQQILDYHRQQKLQEPRDCQGDSDPLDGDDPTSSKSSCLSTAISSPVPNLSPALRSTAATPRLFSRRRIGLPPVISPLSHTVGDSTSGTPRVPRAAPWVEVEEELSEEQHSSLGSDSLSREEPSSFVWGLMRGTRTSVPSWRPPPKQDEEETRVVAAVPDASDLTTSWRRSDFRTRAGVGGLHSPGVSRAPSRVPTPAANDPLRASVFSPHETASIGNDSMSLTGALPDAVEYVLSHRLQSMPRVRQTTAPALPDVPPPVARPLARSRTGKPGRRVNRGNRQLQQPVWQPTSPASALSFRKPATKK